METFESRLNRFLENDVYEIPETILGSLQNHGLWDIRRAADANAWPLALSGMHSAIQIVGEKILGLKPRESTAFFLERFVDGSSDDRKFSKVSAEIHEMRNITTHRWFGRLMHRIHLSTKQDEGWKREGDVVSLNPAIYLEEFEEGFNKRMWSFFWSQYDDEEALRVRKYAFLGEFLEVEKNSPIHDMIKTFPTKKVGLERDDAEQEIKAAIRSTYL